MRAYYVYDEKKDKDHLVIPDIDVLADVDRTVMALFIDVRPDFKAIRGNCLNHLPPDAFGRIVATRDDDGDVCISEPDLWPRRMQRHLG